VQVDVSTALAVGALVFAAGGAWITLARTSKSAASQGRRIGKLENKVSAMEGQLRPRRMSMPLGVPIVASEDDPTAA
jgi:hypothetical protein